MYTNVEQFYSVNGEWVSKIRRAGEGIKWMKENMELRTHFEINKSETSQWSELSVVHNDQNGGQQTVYEYQTEGEQCKCRCVSYFPVNAHLRIVSLLYTMGDCSWYSIRA